MRQQNPNYRLFVLIAVIAALFSYLSLCIQLNDISRITDITETTVEQTETTVKQQPVSTGESSQSETTSLTVDTETSSQTVSGAKSEVWVKNLFKAYGNKLTLSLNSETHNEYTAAYNKRYEYTIYHNNRQCGVFTFDLYEIGNGDIYYCMRTEGMRAVPSSLNIELFLQTDSAYQYRYFTYPRGRDNVSSVLEGPFDSKKTLLSLPYTTYIESDSFSMVASCVNAYKMLDNGVLKDLTDKSTVIELFEGKVTAALSIKKDRLTEHWGIFSKEQLLDFSDAEAVLTTKIADFSRFRKWSMTGQYYITPVSYKPQGSDCFYKNTAHHVGEKFLRTEGRYFEDMSIVALYVAVQDQTPEGIWPTGPESDWLSTDYGIKESFYDTRFNTDAGLFLIRGYRKWKDPVILATAEAYADYLIDFAMTHHYETKNGGYLIWDYTDKEFSLLPTHVSLNHLVTEMNFLYELYIDTDKPVYRLLAEKIKLAVDDTWSYWPKPNKDLWYAYMKDSTFGRDDYVNLTLKDLKYSQKLFEYIYGKTDPKFDYLIQSKESYLKANNLPLY